MSKIPYPHQTPTPNFFFHSGFLDPHKENYTNRRKFLDWIFNNFYCVAFPRNGVYYEAYEFCFSIEKAAEEAGMTTKAFELQVDLYLEKGWLTKRPNQIKNRPNIYKFEAHKFSEKIVSLEQPESFQKQNIGGTNLREEINEKGVTELKKEEPKGEPRGEPFSEREHHKKEEPKEEPKGYFYRTKEQKNVCLKETNINKEKCEAEPESKESLFLSHKEKDLFLEARKDLLSEQVEGLKLYLDYRNVEGITAKTLTRWLRDYSFEDVKDSISLMLDAENKKPDNPGGWIQRALENGWARKERVKSQNRERAIQFKNQNKLHFLKINQRYCVDLRKKDKEFYYHVDPEIFETQLRNCL